MSELKKSVYIMRGISGSGKTTEAKKIMNTESQLIADNLNITIDDVLNQNLIIYCSADGFFMNNGNYLFDYTKLSEAHNSCLRNFVDALFNKDVRSIVVDNTHSMTWEYSPYSSLARAFGCKITIVEVYRDILECFKANTHQVPIDAIKAQYKRFDITPKNFETKIIVIGKLPGLWKRILRRVFRKI